jgi:DNA mismatch repair protein MutL
MSRIHSLDQALVNKIAAGEVVERPASIVKELVENALDAGSTSITIEIKDGGIAYIRVTDNGCGIDEDDALLVFASHATSKLADEAGLMALSTLGFRGEALSSIAAVAKVDLISRMAHKDSGVHIIAEGGEVSHIGPAGCPEGTNIIVRDVFYNTPARLKFLKKPAIEGGYVSEYVERMILSSPSVSFKFINNQKLVYHSPGDGSLKTAVFCIYGKDVLEHIRHVDYAESNMHISGFVGTPDYSRNTRGQQSFFVNGRFIRSMKLSAALQSAYDTRLMGGKFPFCVLNIDIAPAEVDVNVHPNKLEVRFKDDDLLFSCIKLAANGAFTVQTPAKASIGHSYEELSRPTETGKQDTFFTPELKPESFDTHELKIPELNRTDEAPLMISEPDTASIDIKRIPLMNISASTEPPILKTPKKLERDFDFVDVPFDIIGQVFGCYWIVQQGSNLYMIDQHAAHERKLYEKLMQNTASIGAQQLLTPIALQFSPLEIPLIEQNITLIGELGFDVEPFGPQTILLRAVPVLLDEAQAGGMFTDLVDSLSSFERLTSAELKKKRLIQLACKHAIKAGEQISREELTALIKSFTPDSALTCPHGRPWIIKLTKTDFEKMFKRVL